MALVAGTVTVNQDGTVTYTPPTGPNLAKELYEAYLADIEAQIAPEVLPSGPDAAKALQAVASQANTNAATLVAHVVANADVSTTGSGGGQITDGTINSGIACSVDAGTHVGGTTDNSTISGGGWWGYATVNVTGSGGIT